MISRLTQSMNLLPSKRPCVHSPSRYSNHLGCIASTSSYVLSECDPKPRVRVAPSIFFTASSVGPRVSRHAPSSHIHCSREFRKPPYCRPLHRSIGHRLRPITDCEVQRMPAASSVSSALYDSFFPLPSFHLGSFPLSSPLKSFPLDPLLGSSPSESFPLESFPPQRL